MKQENKGILKKGWCICLAIIAIILLFGTPTLAHDGWEVTLDFSEPNGAGDTVWFGEDSTASDGLDHFDYSESPPPPVPYLYAYFDAGITQSPYEKLLNDTRNYPDSDKVWDLYVTVETLSLPTTVTINWYNPISTTEYDHIDLSLYTTGWTKIADMHLVSTVQFIATSSTPYHLQIICHVNQPPTSADKTVTTNEDITYTFLSTDFDFNDDDTAIYDDQLEKIKITQLETKGSLELSGVDVTLDQEISRADIDAGNLKYTPALNENGVTYTNFKFMVSDGIDYSTVAYTMTIDVTDVNDAPVVTDIPDQTIAEGSTFTTITLDNYVSDVDNTDAEMTWTYSGNTALTVNMVNRIATITIPNADWNGAETITFKATDPGALFDQDAATFTVTAVNNAPTANPQSVTTNQDTTIEITLTGSDIDGSISKYTIATLPSYGDLWDGITQITTIPTDLIVNIVQYQPHTGYSGSDSFTFTVTDDGTPLPAQTSSPATISITIITVNQINVKYQWNLISLPVDATISKADIIVRYNGQNYTWAQAVSEGIVLNTIYNWQRGTTQAYGFTTSTLLPGEGYWMWAYHDCEVLIANSAVGTGHITDLQTSWNIMGLPCSTPLATAGLITTYDGHDHTWTQAITENIILGFIYGWNSSLQRYTLTTTFESGEGYWMYAYVGCTLKQT
ncbi:Uncharacterised protein [uncultured archaeon]|nr:Uncharacterised protein [uncultured archaeon]